MQQSLTYEEKNALYYEEGYIPRALHKQLKHSKHELKEELILCLHELTEDDGIDDESQDWIKKIRWFRACQLCNVFINRGHGAKATNNTSTGNLPLTNHQRECHC